MEDQLKADHLMFTDLWRFYKKYFEVKEDNAFWDEVIRKAEDLCQKHETEFCRDVVVKILAELERKHKELIKYPQSAPPD